MMFKNIEITYLAFFSFAKNAVLTIVFLTFYLQGEKHETTNQKAVFKATFTKIFK